MSSRQMFLDAYASDAGRFRLINDLEPYFHGCRDRAREKLSGLQENLAHEDERIWRPAVLRIAEMVEEDADVR